MMIKEITTERIPVKMWLSEVEEGALAQARNLANLPFAFHHIALMPDCHQGFGMPIGAVLATKDVIIPNAVGVDIGCGMCAVRTSLTEPLPQVELKRLLSAIRAEIPLGFKRHKTARDASLMPDSSGTSTEMPVVEREYKSALHQLGTLGGGNHFIEMQEGDDRHIWIMVHSGSRNIGKQVADYYNRMAVNLNARWNSPVPRSYQLAYLPLDSEEGQQYVNEMNYCIRFALANRKWMMERIVHILSSFVRGSFQTDPMINIAHNYAIQERHFGTDVMIHRKGATHAGKETLGIIPGSQGTNSYIVRGKGNADSFSSCSHGAGRVMGRKEAIRSLDLQTELRKLEQKGVLHALRNRGDLEEASGAYKDIGEVMRNQSDLVQVLVELRPLAVIKG
jgi:tRNA-splicing ligase RtcB (3'-phosphate/5'-hydroxy nucleic acid ligase)